MPSVEYKGFAHPRVEAQIPRLTDAHSAGQYVKMSCCWCKITRMYRPLDILKLVGDVHVLKLHRRFYCEKCGRKDYMAVEFKNVMGSEIAGMRIRELVEIRMVKKPIWRDTKL
ncbi:hypothetical protein [Rhizobium sp. LCM 4573]|uniref:hypothetical protein n=1 Tax=Rhizobium sp. LCM 4573 TaxID=1848291 RepID=UPI0008DB2E99|nr:hypothetical protein [Rhizobium sp. LCM 4573]OHV81590.1 hypothetical protein LCM4573_21130 [Rhizobium sp. LCM 4573]